MIKQGHQRQAYLAYNLKVQMRRVLWASQSARGRGGRSNSLVSGLFVQLLTLALVLYRAPADWF
ncbi:hypothetical protein O71_16280 [Pontibacter sp. BAB1700]|nr:hypothetical protein O71_16280 [Pontibacter sp. BAB1700]